VRSLALACLLGALLPAASACNTGAPSPAEIADRSWRAHELVVAAGERAATCAEAGPAMQRVFAEHRQAFVDGLALDRDRKKLEEATVYLAAHESRYKDLESRMADLSDRCAGEPTVVAVFRMMESP
jgi:hypothetical protein